MLLNSQIISFFQIIFFNGILPWLHLCQRSYPITSILWNLLRLALWLNIWLILVNCWCTFEWNSRLNIPCSWIKSTLVILLKFTCWYFYLLVLSITERMVLKSPNIIAHFSISTFIFVSFCYIFEAVSLGAYKDVLIISSWWNETYFYSVYF